MRRRHFLPGSMLAVLALPLSPVPVYAQDFDDLVRQAAEQNAIPATWVRAVLHAESAGDPHAVSGAGAMGLMQLMPGTWKDVRRTLNLGVDPFDPHDNIAAGAAYLRWLHDRYGDAGFLAAYNAGPGRYDDHLASGRPLPAETVSYVAQVRTLIGDPIVSTAGVLPKIVADWRAGSLFIAAGKTVPNSVRPIPVSMEKNAVQLHPFPAEFLPMRDGSRRADFFVARSAPEQEGDVRAEVMKP
ncbi:lytic transglycosylase domain-containing protein [Acetobacter sp. P1H12_c]|uniref:lytic transglycosylase domain-containing protein n=1 Tax=Acetobacter sp. P1H12_c TaxID=2762621 RepID=UPI00207B866F|nr:lytic transglycosylase domain-containing protein [Acetobacter sp. P1H12_c]